MNSSNLNHAKFLEVRAGVRHWDDATLNGNEDQAGQMPCRRGDLWHPVIDLATGHILDWPAGTEASVSYKVCDAGEYWLLDDAKQRIAKWKDCYVPNDLLCIGDNGYGDYILLKVSGDGTVTGWKKPQLDAEEWASA
jgi:hypothetical protein